MRGLDYSHSVSVVFLLIFTPVTLIACMAVVRAAGRARRGRPKPHLNLLAVAFGLLGLALPVHAYGQLRKFYFMIDEECPARGAGAFVEFRESFLPVSGVLECTDRTIQLVPAWVNPVLSILLALATAAALAASVLWLRSRRPGPQHYVRGGPKALEERWASSLRWEEVGDFFDPDLMGALPDVVVPRTSVDDWQAVLDLVAERGWAHQYAEGGRALPAPRAETVFARSADAECPELKVWLAHDVLAIFRFHSPESIDFDVDLRELQGQQRLDLFCAFLAAIGRKLSKPVLMDAEGGDGTHPVLGYSVEHDRVVQLAETSPRLLRVRRTSRGSSHGMSPLTFGLYRSAIRLQRTGF